MAVAFLAYALLNAGQVFQKLGLDRILNKERFGYTIWFFANLMTILSVLVTLQALTLGPVSLVGAMAGSGLIVMALFSRVFLKERITAPVITGIAIIVIGVGLLGGFQDAEQSAYGAYALLQFFVILAALFLAMIFFSRKARRINSAFLAGLAGSLAGFSTLYQKAASFHTGGLMIPSQYRPWLVEFLAPASGQTSGQAWPATATVEKWMAILLNPYVPLWILLSVLSMILIHVAFARGLASLTIPVYTTFFILVPVMGGSISFGESLHPLQWLGALVITTGAVLVNARQDFSTSPSNQG